MKYELFLAFSSEAQEEIEISKRTPSWFKKTKFDDGYGWAFKTFNSKEERDAYIQGLEDGNGWSNDVYYEDVK